MSQGQDALNETLIALDAEQAAFLKENEELVTGDTPRYIAAIFPIDVDVNGDGDLITTEPVALIPVEVAQPYFDKLITVTPHALGSALEDDGIGFEECQRRGWPAREVAKVL